MLRENSEVFLHSSPPALHEGARTEECDILSPPSFSLKDDLSPEQTEGPLIFSHQVLYWLSSPSFDS